VLKEVLRDSDGYDSSQDGLNEPPVEHQAPEDANSDTIEDSININPSISGTSSASPTILTTTSVTPVSSSVVQVKRVQISIRQFKRVVCRQEADPLHPLFQ
jgi:hypothetical protein